MGTYIDSKGAKLQLLVEKEKEILDFLLSNDDILDFIDKEDIDDIATLEKFFNYAGYVFVDKDEKYFYKECGKPTPLGVGWIAQ